MSLGFLGIFFPQKQNCKDWLLAVLCSIEAMPLTEDFKEINYKKNPKKTTLLLKIWPETVEMFMYSSSKYTYF